MTIKKKRTRSDTAQAAVEAFNDAAKPINPPEHIHLRPGDLPFWHSVVSARARSTWTSADLENAANLTRCKADIERLQKEIDAEGDTIENARGTMVVNPKHTLLETLSRRAVALSRMLHVHAEATVGDSRDSKKAAENQAKATATLDSHNDLIPKAH